LAPQELRQHILLAKNGSPRQCGVVFQPLSTRIQLISETAKTLAHFAKGSCREIETEWIGAGVSHYRPYLSFVRQRQHWTAGDYRYQHAMQAAGNDNIESAKQIQKLIGSVRTRD